MRGEMELAIFGSTNVIAFGKGLSRVKTFLRESQEEQDSGQTPILVD
jgi:hypothetical protein